MREGARKQKACILRARGGSSWGDDRDAVIEVYSPRTRR